MSQVEILYPAWNRLHFTGLTWHLLMNNTDWSLVRKLTVYDDGSEDGTYEFLRDHLSDCPVDTVLLQSDIRSPPAIMNHFLETRRAPFFAKVDNDICVPPGWLNTLLGVMRAEPNLEILGMEAGQCPGDVNGSYGWQPCTHIGGVGLMRTKAFKVNPSVPSRGRFGFTEWQQRYNIVRGWIDPDLMVPQIDRIPMEPWMSFTQDYIERGWNRDWGYYPKSASRWWNWIDELKRGDA